MMLAPLTRACGRKDDCVGMCHKSVQQLIRMNAIEVFGNLEAQYGIKAPAQIPRSRKVLLGKKGSGHKQGVFGHHNTVDAEDISDPGIKCRLQPCTRTTPHIKEASRQLSYENAFEGLARAILCMQVQRVVVINFGHRYFRTT
jgi:hypothetical protein